MAPSVLFWLFNVFIFADAAAFSNIPPPLFYCSYLQPNICHLENVKLRRDQRKYNIVGHGNTLAVEVIASTAFTVVSPDICIRFPKLKNFTAQAQGVEIVDEDAFKGCHKLELVNLAVNKIAVLPEDLLRNCLYLKYFDVHSNVIGNIPAHSFEKNLQLQSLDVSNNWVSDFPPTLVSSNGRIRTLALHSNLLMDLDSRSLARLPYLKSVTINGNLFPCSKIKKILQGFRFRRGLVVSPVQVKKKPLFNMFALNDTHVCVAGQ